MGVLTWGTLEEKVCDGRQRFTAAAYNHCHRRCCQALQTSSAHRPKLDDRARPLVELAYFVRITSDRSGDELGNTDPADPLATKHVAPRPSRPIAAERLDGLPRGGVACCMASRIPSRVAPQSKRSGWDYWI